MRSKIIFKKNLLKLTILGCVIAFAEEMFFAFYMLNYVDEDKRWVMIVVMCLLVSAVLSLFMLLFGQYLIVNDETVTFGKYFKRKKTINWKDATVSETVVSDKNGTHRVTVISDGNNKIEFAYISENNLSLLKDLCKTARERYNNDNLTF